MIEKNLVEVAYQFDDLYGQMDNIDSLAHALMLASNAGIDANNLTGALCLLNHATQETRSEMNRLNKLLNHKASLLKGQLKEKN